VSEKRDKVRPARSNDLVEIVRLRREMFLAMAASDSAARPELVSDTSWHAAAESELREQLREGSLMAFVIETGTLSTGSDARVVGCSVAQLLRRLPGPGFPTGLSGTISNVCVEHRYRGRGYGGALTEAALAWLTTAGAEVVDLHATPDSENLYHSLGFAPPASKAMRLLLT
jgi:ribosomal protein S18 acetylase RimI-like enzyme